MEKTCVFLKYLIRAHLDRCAKSGFTKPMNFTFFGYPKTGKTTLFNILTGSRIEVKTYENGKKETNQRTCPLPDSRLDRIGEIYSEKKKIFAMVDFVDLAGISYGEVKSSAYLSRLRKSDSLIHVVRGFQDDKIPHPRGKISPNEDITFMEEELVLSDMISVESRLEKLKKDLTKTKDPEGEKEKEVLERLHPYLEEGKAIREFLFSPSEEKQVRNFAFLSQKPLLHMINIDEAEIPQIPSIEQNHTPPKKGTAFLAFCGKIEEEIHEMENEEEKKAFLSAYGLRSLTADRFFRISFNLLEVIHFFTIGKDEVRAWAIPKNFTASRAAGVIHSDLETGFIRAEVISWEELLHIGSFQLAKEKGAIRLEGKDYLVQDGDVIYFRFAP
ncbi:MAG: redox-regulated ATPase YchF [Candidatus Aminicenantales bacterium]